MKLRDRQEKITIEGNIYGLTLIWNRELLGRSVVGMSPAYAYITKNSRNFALIGCSSNINGFFVESFHLAMENPAWRMNFNYLNINTILFRDILVRLPL
ncbi:MAG: hypothetical protein HDR88_12110 [Bacteroides sp.]|nr:hypothetical protein [Bacteroides sp.]